MERFARYEMVSRWNELSTQQCELVRNYQNQKQLPSDVTKLHKRKKERKKK
jgi:hypothetical protein